MHVPGVGAAPQVKELFAATLSPGGDNSGTPVEAHQHVQSTPRIPPAAMSSAQDADLAPVRISHPLDRVFKPAAAVAKFMASVDAGKGSKSSSKEDEEEESQ
jgi:hypothetical protein